MAEGSADQPRLSVVVPVRNDARALAGLLDELASERCEALEVIVVDGGSQDGAADLAAARGCVVVASAPGRGRQLAAGIRRARGAWLWFLHADSRGVQRPLHWLLRLSADGSPAPGRCWGRFDVSFYDGGRRMTMVAWSMNLRSRLTGICTGDQGLFVERRALETAGGMPEQPLMEDIELSRRLKRVGPAHSSRERLGTSARRWHQHGVLVTVLSMWWFRLRYWLGASPERLARTYYR